MSERDGAPAHVSAADPRPGRRELLFWLLFCGVLAFAFRDLRTIGSMPHPGLDSSEEFFFSPSAVSPLLVGVLAAWFLWNRRRRLRSALGLARGYDRVIGGSLWCVAAGVFAWSHYVEAAPLLIPSLMAALFGTAWIGGGRAAASAIRRPVWFLLFAIPLPAALLNQILYPLQVATADFTATLLSAVGIHAVAFGDRVFRPTAVFQVIESCSGLRGTITLVMAAVVYNELFPRAPRHQRWLIATAPLIGMVANEIRVISIVLSPYSQFAAVHTLQGVVVIALGVFAIAWMDSALYRILGRPEWVPLRWPKRRHPLDPAFCGLALGGALVVAVGSLALPTWEDPRLGRVSLSRIPSAAAGWRSESLPLDQQFLGTVRYSEWVHRRYTRGTEEVFLMVGSDTRLEREEDILSFKSAVPGSGWEAVERRPRPDWPWGASALGVEFTNLHAETMVSVTFQYGFGRPGPEALRSFLAIDRFDRWRREPGVVVRVGTLAEPAAGGRDAAEARLRDFLEAFGPAIEAVAQGRRPR